MVRACRSKGQGVIFAGVNAHHQVDGGTSGVSNDAGSSGIKVEHIPSLALLSSKLAVKLAR